MNQLSSSTIISSAITPTAGVAGTSAITSTVIDSANADGVLFVVRMGAITGAVTSVKAQHSDVFASGYEDIADTNQVIADTADDSHVVLDLRRPDKRYVRIVVSRATQNAVVASATALVYGARSQPVTQPAGTALEAFSDAISGTA